MPTLGERIKAGRERRHLRQRDLAEMVGVDVKTVDNWENGRTRPKNRLGALEEALQINLRESADDELAEAEEDDALQDLIDQARRERAGGDPTLYNMLMRLQRMSEPARDTGDEHGRGGTQQAG
jgi:transcriptional regulator with XRE-family HTH domain